MLTNCHTYYSLRFGTFSEEELINLALKNDYKSLVLTDINNTSACLNFIRQSQLKGIKPIVGIDFRNGFKQMYIGIAKNNKGFENLNRFLSNRNTKKLDFEDKAPELEDVYFVYPFERLLELNYFELKTNEFIGVKPQDFSKIRFTQLINQTNKLIVQQEVSFRNKRDFNIHRLLRAIDENELLSKLPSTEHAKQSDVLWTQDDISDVFCDYPHILENTLKLLDSCSIHFDFSLNRTSQNKLFYKKSLEEDIEFLKELCNRGKKYRYSETNSKIEERIKMELDLIIKLDFVPFFLINWDIIQYAHSQNYFHIGRGSGANSIVAYLLGITDVDPIDLDLYFERFMNLYRANPPDFDIDFSWRDREDVTRYIFERFGANNQVALMGTYNCFKHKGAVRELGKVFGLPKHEIDLLSSGKYNYDTLDELSQMVHRYAGYINGFPNHLGIHAGGVLISEKPIFAFTAINFPPKGFPTTQFDMVIAEDVGLYKYDILGQRGLGKIKDAITLVQKNNPEARIRDIRNIRSFIYDDRINTMISKGNCMGCFYVESPSMRMLLQKLEVNNYLGLVAASSIIRPGVAKSGMMREYILRHKNPERRQNAHPIMQSLMPETYGIMVYQEDVIKVAHHFADLTLGEADVLRRGMSGKFRSRSEFEHIQLKFKENCLKKGYELALIEEIWKQIESFAGYAFAKGHSASYAVESYQSLYLKCYYPLEYMVAVLNNGGGFYSQELYIHEARMCGGQIESPHINHSFEETSIQGKTIYLGLNMLEKMDYSTIQRILEAREKGGPFLSLDNFVERVYIGIESLDTLIRINAFRDLHKNKRNLLWRANLLLNKNKNRHEKTLFEDSTPSFELPDLPINAVENTFDEIELLGFPLSNPFTLLKSKVDSINAVDLKSKLTKMVSIIGYLVTVKYTKTNTNKYMGFGTFLDKKGDWIDTVHFPNSFKAYPFKGRGIYQLTGKVVEEFGYISIEVSSLKKLDYIEDPRFKVE